jgi:SEC-C motif-containing protein
MRSRYSAYHQHQFDYIADTMRPPASDHFDVEDAKNSELDMQWVKLEVVKSTRDTVEFRAHYLLDGQDYVLHEISEFKQINGKWYYVNGTHSDNKSNTSKVGRNDPCPCNSGKKYKKCCG